MKRGLNKTTLTIFSDRDLSDDTLTEIGVAADAGDAHCTKRHTEHVPEPEADPDWDGNEFFEDGGEPVAQ